MIARVVVLKVAQGAGASEHPETIREVHFTIEVHTTQTIKFDLLQLVSLKFDFHQIQRYSQLILF